MSVQDVDFTACPKDLPDLTRLDRDQVARTIDEWTRHLHRLEIGETPVTSELVDGVSILLKREDLSRSKSYKERGASSAVLYAQAAGFDAGVCASTGNFANGVGTACQRFGFSAIVFVPSTTPRSKINALRERGLDVRIEGATFSESQLRAEDYAREHAEVALLEPYDAESTIVGQASVGSELIDDVSHAYDTIVAPVGGGGLLSALALVHYGRRSNVRIIGVCSDAAPAVQVSFALGRYTEIPTRPSIANGVNVARPGRKCLPIIERFVDDVVLVSDDDVDAAMSWLERRGIFAEGAGAVALAAVLSCKFARAGSRGIAVIVSGGNIATIDTQGACTRARRLDGLHRDAVVPRPSPPVS